MGVLLVNLLVLPMTEPHSNQPKTKQNFGSFFFFFFFTNLQMEGEFVSLETDKSRGLLQARLDPGTETYGVILFCSPALPLHPGRCAPGGGPGSSLPASTLHSPGNSSGRKEASLSKQF